MEMGTSKGENWPAEFYCPVWDYDGANAYPRSGRLGAWSPTSRRSSPRKAFPWAEDMGKYEDEMSFLRGVYFTMSYEKATHVTLSWVNFWLSSPSLRNCIFA
jgi:hypothetical protein